MCFMWVSVTIAWRVLRLRIEETASRYRIPPPDMEGRCEYFTLIEMYTF